MRAALLACAGSIALMDVTFANADDQGRTADPPGGKTDKSAPEAKLETIVVTAENRKNSAQKTPISMSVYSRKAIKAEGIHDAQSLSRIDPSLKFESQLGGTASLAIRGISSQDTTEIGDPAVSIATDGLFVDRLVAVNATLYDLSRIEVLRGPQGTLYGRNSVGGDVNILSQRPTKDYSGSLTVDYGNYDTINTDGSVNIPLSDKVQIRGAYASRNHSGYRNNPGFDRGDDEDTQSGRASIAIEPSDTLKLWAQVQFTHEGGVGPVAEGLPFTFINGPLPNGTVGPIDISHQMPAGINPRTFRLYAPFGLNIQDTHYIWDAVYSGLPWDLTLTYSGGYDLIEDHEVADATNLSVPPLIPSPIFTNQRPGTINQELLLTSPSGHRLIWQAGFFYFKENNSLDSYQTLLDGNVAGGTPQIKFLFPSVEATSYAGFAQGSYAVTPTLKITLGGRQTFDTKSRSGNSLLYPELFGIPPSVQDPSIPLAINPANGSSSSSKFTYTANLEWTPVSESFNYVKVNTGYKTGGFNSNGLNTALPYGPETVTNYEVGTKDRFGGGRGEIDATGFYDDYKGYQAQVFSCNLCSNPLSGIQNAGAARIFGLETSLLALVDPVGRFAVHASYLNARFTQFNAGLTNFATGAQGNVNLAGNRLIQAPAWTIGASLDHEWSLDNGAHLQARIETNFQTKQYFSFQNTPDTLQKPYTVSNASVTYTAASGWYNLVGYIDNFENSVSFNHAQENGDVTGLLYAFNPPRTFGVRLTVNFGAAR